ncbi:MAG: rhodanese-like domain-containing protein [Candidatus Jettenia sp.]|uniref:Rhodanese domain-containing protein n=1 Tax=Candidatus Jettenia caeni TaxID=247490 RepID=I3IPY8_9BACT|nr:rhodanese-like domain-containing protein [Candidatus Jettenia sp. AMX1]MBC6928955.1 rhodanese-like domain-containing protein [Candidatus Jettenia sp.]NUN24845.1 rhodanese-like domain-containing protein [Candidatus Jettenia caeni]KAA0250376.1 MAG: rhodanese-like domain-containing protein [Candidatus Jettenia sp. AMX1]MCE7880910.1 rhodanese-like domain-containing protein [Candidatus Jettenia sp. AMX1]MCQ3927000.1 rhodanese-like domain-containing protein [Candidatus Jettenia sp.]
MAIKRYIRVTGLLVGMILFLNTIMGILIFKKLHADKEDTKTEVKNITPKQAKELIDHEKDIFILDVRTEEEYDKVHLKSANLIPIQELEQNIERIPKDKQVIVHCAAGVRSAKACKLLKDKGLKELYNMEGGINKWQEEGYPVEKH